jgi:diguanylate cyclase (GGDEF)-like protein
LRASDTACRFGGDEFIIVLPDLLDSAEAERVVQKIVTATASGIEVNGRHLPLQFSYGIAIYPQDGAEVGQLLHKADRAMYQVKAERRHTTSMPS